MPTAINGVRRNYWYTLYVVDCEVLTLDHKKFLRLNILLGLSLIISAMLSLYLREKTSEILKLNTPLDFSTVVFLIIGFTLVIESIVIYRDITIFPSFGKGSMKRNIWDSTRKLLIKLFPYVFLFVFCMMFILKPEIIVKMITDIYFIFIIILAIPITLIIFEVYRGIIGFSAIVKRLVPDNKDRLTIAIAVLATVISAIALLK